MPRCVYAGITDTGRTVFLHNVLSYGNRLLDGAQVLRLKFFNRTRISRV
jgi:hypothetical protein